MRLHNITRSSNIRGRGNCGKPKSLCATMIFQILSKRRNCGKRRGFMWMKCYLSIFRGFFRHFRPETRRQGKKSCRCGILPRFYRWKTLITCPPVIVEKFLKNLFSTSLWRGFPQFPKASRASKNGIRVEFWGFLEFYTKDHGQACAKLIFSTHFSTSCGKVCSFPETERRIGGKLMGEPGFFHRECRQLPLTSLTISSISARKTGF